MLVAAAVAMVPFALLLAFGYRRIGPVTLAVGLATGTAVQLLMLAGSGLISSVPWLYAVSLVAALFAVNTMAAISPSRRTWRSFTPWPDDRHRVVLQPPRWPCRAAAARAHGLLGHRRVGGGSGARALLRGHSVAY